MVINVVTKLEGFIDKTKVAKENKRKVNKAGKPPENEIYIAKTHELDNYLRQQKETKVKINKIKLELDKNEEYKRMVDSENQAKA